MCDADIELLDDDCLLEIFERLPLLDQICASKVCSRWKGLCEKLLKRVHKLTGDGRTWRFDNNHGKILTATADTEALKTILANCSKYIRKLCVIGDKIPSDPSEFQLIMGITTARCENIRLMEFEQIYDVIILKIIPIIIRRNKNLLILRLRHMYHLDLYSTIEHLPECLLEFQILNVSPTDPNVLIEVFASCPNIKRFGCNVVQDTVAESISFREDLEYLRLKLSFTIPESFHHLAQLKSLVYLDLEKAFALDDEGLIDIAYNCQQLQGLMISSCNKITDIGFSSLANLERLAELRMRELEKVTDISFAMLPASLQVVYCCGCVKLLDNGVIRFLIKATDLRELYINDSRITNYTIEAAIRIVEEQESSRNLKIYAYNSRANRRTIDQTLMEDLPLLLQLFF